MEPISSKPPYYLLNDDHTVSPCWDTTKWGNRNRRVGFDKLDGDVDVSTVFLGIDHAWGGGPPILFETMVFGGPWSDWQARYHTWDEAVAGHERVVENLRGGADPDGSIVDGEVVAERLALPAGGELPEGGERE